MPVAAVALGACIVEKHMTLSADDTTLDATFSLDRDAFREMVDAVRVTERALGSTRIGPTDSEAESRRFRRSLFVVEDIAAGEPLTEPTSADPAGRRMHTRHYEEVLGRRAPADRSGTPLTFELLADPEDPPAG